jgi:flagellar basal body L-ring protein FlgH
MMELESLHDSSLMFSSAPCTGLQVKIRGESMQAAADATESGMVSIIGLSADKVQDICTAANEKLGSQAVQIANFLCSGNYVISGSKEVQIWSFSVLWLWSDTRRCLSLRSCHGSREYK